MGGVFLESWPFFVVVAALAAIALLTRRPRRPSEPPGYARRRGPWEPREIALFRALRYAVGNQHLVLSKVRLGELVAPLEKDRHAEADLHRIDAGHVDFLLCHPDSLRPELVVQCDAPASPAAEVDKSGKEPQVVGQAEGEFVLHVLGSAGIPCLAVSVDEQIEVRSLRRMIRQSLAHRRTRRRAG